MMHRDIGEAAGLRPHDVQGKLFWEAWWWSYSEAVQQQLREAGYPNATVDVIRTVAEALEHTSHWSVRRDG